ncbi:uncharacterized protein KY384_008015 [Bacidia gigantensis]|uniref:uncharacterized protein n=1 Tax=Bacidia gigantensis TaxID=2732470 RepID=UPI001D038775|nr:uncharacterized protein KY384_008015 [Bacidia gigantensis]KAG8527271.1 hypothetical protein KY384_008015 [Bacidia gigantensis]
MKPTRNVGTLTDQASISLSEIHVVHSENRVFAVLQPTVDDASESGSETSVPQDSVFPQGTTEDAGDSEDIVPDSQVAPQKPKRRSGRKGSKKAEQSDDNGARGTKAQGPDWKGGSLRRSPRLGSQSPSEGLSGGLLSRCAVYEMSIRIPFGDLGIEDELFNNLQDAVPGLTRSIYRELEITCSPASATFAQSEEGLQAERMEEMCAKIEASRDTFNRAVEEAIKRRRDSVAARKSEDNHWNFFSRLYQRLLSVIGRVTDAVTMSVIRWAYEHATPTKLLTAAFVIAIIDILERPPPDEGQASSSGKQVTPSSDLSKNSETSRGPQGSNTEEDKASSPGKQTAPSSDLSTQSPTPRKRKEISPIKNEDNSLKTPKLLKGKESPTPSDRDNTPKPQKKQKRKESSPSDVYSHGPNGSQPKEDEMGTRGSTLAPTDKIIESVETSEEKTSMDTLGAPDGSEMDTHGMTSRPEEDDGETSEKSDSEEDPKEDSSETDGDPDNQHALPNQDITGRRLRPNARTKKDELNETRIAKHGMRTRS